jgi:hypothetical protein
VNGSHEKHESIILVYDERVRKAVRETLSSSLKHHKSREFERSRTVVKDMVDTCTELLVSVDQAFDTAKTKLDRY